MKMYSNTINIVHSHFRRKEHLYYLFRPHFCHEQTPVLGTYSFLSISSKKNISSTLIMRPFGLELKVEWTLKVQLTLLVPASPWPWCQRWTLLHIQHSGVYHRQLWWPGSWQAWPRRKAWPRLRLCALARISKIMIPLNPQMTSCPLFEPFLLIWLLICLPSPSHNWHIYVL